MPSAEVNISFETAAKREPIDTGGDKRYVRRDGEEQFKESDDVGRSLSHDRKQKARKQLSLGKAT